MNKKITNPKKKIFFSTPDKEMMVHCVEIEKFQNYHKELRIKWEKHFMAN